jgi:hypothetical protein
MQVYVPELEGRFDFASVWNKLVLYELELDFPDGTAQVALVLYKFALAFSDACGIRFELDSTGLAYVR